LTQLLQNLIALCLLLDLPAVRLDGPDVVDRLAVVEGTVLARIDGGSNLETLVDCIVVLAVDHCRLLVSVFGREGTATVVALSLLPLLIAHS
jgi:hypothetical protein